MQFMFQWHIWDLISLFSSTLAPKWTAITKQEIPSYQPPVHIFQCWPKCVYSTNQHHHIQLSTYCLPYIRLPKMPNYYIFTLKMENAMFDMVHPRKLKLYTDIHFNVRKCLEQCWSQQLIALLILPIIWEYLGPFHVRPIHFRGKIFMTIPKPNKLKQACWVPLGRGIYKILPTSVHYLQRYNSLKF